MADPGPVRSARAEAAEVAGPDYSVRVLEPSPPADTDPAWLADDPVNAAGDGRPVVSPIANGDLTWNELAADDPSVASFAAERWLGSFRRLQPLRPEFRSTRLALHRVAAYVVSPARRQVNDKIGLRYTVGGFGTPFFGPDRQVRVEGHDLVVEDRDGSRRAPITSLEAAAQLVDVAVDVEWASQFDIPEPGSLDADLAVDAASAVALGNWFGFAWSVLEELRADEASVEASRPQLWPEHFDPAIEIGLDERHQRASYGFSPGDVGRDGSLGPEPDPYLYVGPWYPDDRPDSDYWNASGFPGALLRYRDLVEADDQRATALSFLRSGRDLLLAG